MNTKVIAIIGCLTSALAVVAYFVSAGNNTKPPATTQTSRLFASANATDISRMTISQGEKKVEIVREGTTWLLASRDNYPAIDDRARELVRRVIDAEVIEEKTSNTELYARLGVEDATTPTAKGTLVSLTKADGSTIASLIIGNRQDAANWDSEKAATFVRPADSAKSYLVKGTFITGLEPVEWMKREVLTFSPDRFWKAAILAPATEAVQIERATPTATATLTNLPAGRELTDANKPQQVLEALANVTLEDVRKAANLDFSQAAVSTFTTYQGIILTARSTLADGKTWVNFAVAYDKQLAAPLAEGATAPTDETVAVITKEAAELQARLAPWAYQLPDWKVSNIRPLMADMLKPLNAPTPQSESAPPSALPPGLAPPQ